MSSGNMACSDMIEAKQEQRGQELDSVSTEGKPLIIESENYNM